MTDDKLLLLSLCKAGYGSLDYLGSLDTPDLLDICEYESITADISHHLTEHSKNGNRK